MIMSEYPAYDLNKILDELTIFQIYDFVELIEKRQVNNLRNTMVGMRLAFWAKGRDFNAGLPVVGVKGQVKVKKPKTIPGFRMTQTRKEAPPSKEKGEG